MIRRLLALLLLCLLPTQALAAGTLVYQGGVVTGGGGDVTGPLRVGGSSVELGKADNTTYYVAIGYGAVLSDALTYNLNATERNRELIAPVAATAKNLAVLLTNAPGGTATNTYTLRVNEVDTALTVTISTTGVSAVDSANTVALVAGDRISIKRTATNTPAASDGTIILRIAE